jgi:hypothetical protein
MQLAGHYSVVLSTGTLQSDTGTKGQRSWYFIKSVVESVPVSKMSAMLAHYGIVQRFLTDS